MAADRQDRLLALRVKTSLAPQNGSQIVQEKEVYLPLSDSLYFGPFFPFLELHFLRPGRQARQEDWQKQQNGFFHSFLPRFPLSSSRRKSLSLIASRRSNS